MDPSAETPANESLPKTPWGVNTRIGIAAAGAALFSLGLARRGSVGTLAGVAGAGCLLSAFLNKPAWQLLGNGAGGRAVELHKTLVVDAPLEEVFEIWRNFQNFPKFMRNVSEVTQLDDKRSRWVVEGPAGAPLEWDTELTVCLRNERLSWKTLPCQLIEHTGSIGFAAVPDGKTSVDIQMSYNPPEGVIDRLAILLARVDSKSLLDIDLIELQALLEGRRPGAARDPGEERKRSPSPESQSQRLRGNEDETPDPRSVDASSADFGPYVPADKT